MFQLSFTPHCARILQVNGTAELDHMIVFCALGSFTDLWRLLKFNSTYDKNILHNYYYRVEIIPYCTCMML